LLEFLQADGAPVRPLSVLFLQPRTDEPPHIHVDRDDLSAKFWLEPVQLVRNFGFRANELRAIQSLVMQHREEFLEAWNEFFGIGG
jgi:hypothetical protein